MVSIHCVCHRQALAAPDAYNGVVYLRNTVQPLLAGVYQHFKNSLERKASLNRVHKFVERTMPIAG